MAMLPKTGLLRAIRRGLAAPTTFIKPKQITKRKNVSLKKRKKNTIKKIVKRKPKKLSNKSKNTAKKSKKKTQKRKKHG